MTIHNAQITSTFLGPEDHGIMTFFVHLSWNSAGIGYGGYGLDRNATGDNHRVPRRGDGHGYQAIRHIIETLEVGNWESLKGQLCRIDFDDGPGLIGKVTRIGHILKDQWFDLATYMKEQRA